MNAIHVIKRPEIIAQTATKLLRALLLAAVVNTPGLLLMVAGFQVAGTLALFAGSFSLMARRYRKPWPLNPVMTLVPPVAAGLGMIIQWSVFSTQMPSSILTAVAIICGIAFGWQRGHSHRLYLEKNQLMAERTIQYLLVWVVCSGFTQVVGLLQWKFLVTTGMMSNLFSVAMLSTVAVVILRKASSTAEQECGLVKPGKKMARAATMAALGLVLSGVSASNVAAQEDIVTRMRDVGRQSVADVAGRGEGLLDQNGLLQEPGVGSGKSLRIDAAFGVHGSDVDSRVDFTRFDDWRVAKRVGESRIKTLRKGSVQTGSENSLRGDRSFSVAYDPREMAGPAHRAIIQHGHWLIDVDTRSWNAEDEKMAAAQFRISNDLAASLFDHGVQAGLIELDTSGLMDHSPADSTPAQAAPADVNSISPLAESTELGDLSRLTEELGDGGVTPEQIAAATTLITILLVASGFTVEGATAIAQAIVESMLDEDLESRIPGEIDEEELRQAANAAEQELEEDMTAHGFTDRKPESLGTASFFDPDVIRDAARGAKEDAVEALHELAELAPVFGVTIAETLRDISAFTASGFDWERIQEVKGDLVSAGHFIHGMVEQLAQLAGTEFAENIDQDSNVLAAIELLAIVARNSALSGAGQDAAAQARLLDLLTNRREEVIAGLERIAKLTGKGAFEVARLAIGAQEWENAVNGDLSPLTRIANALAGSFQTATLLHGAGTKIAGRFADDGIGILDDAATRTGNGSSVPGYMDEMADGARPRQRWPFETRRNPETGAIEFRNAPGETFKPLPEEVATRMRNEPIFNGQYRMNPDTGVVEWRNPKTGRIEKAPLDNDVRPGYERSPERVYSGRDADLKNLPGGAVIPDELLPQTGYAPHQLDELARIAREENVIFAGRTTNMDSLQHIANGTGTPKPVYIKSKTIQKLDTYLGAAKDDVGLVGFFEPKMPANIDQLPKKLADEIKARFKLRAEEYAELYDEISALKNVEIKDGKLYRIPESGGKRLPFAGDIDPVYIRDAKTGKIIVESELPGGKVHGNLREGRYHNVLRKLKESGAEIQHGAEFNMSMDLLRKLEPGTPAYKKTLAKVAKLHAKLEKGHTSGAEIAVEMWPDGKLRRADQLRWLGLEV